MLVYKIDVLSALKSKGFNVARMRKEKRLSEATIQNLRDGKMVGIKSVDSICGMLGCQPNHFIKYIPDPEES